MADEFVCELAVDFTFSTEEKETLYRAFSEIKINPYRHYEAFKNAVGDLRSAAKAERNRITSIGRISAYGHAQPGLARSRRRVVWLDTKRLASGSRDANSLSNAARDLWSRASIVLSGAAGRPEGRVGFAFKSGAMFNPFEFIQQARVEGAKVTWPSRRETLVTTGLVLAMVFVTALFFLAVDQGIRLLVTFILSLGR